MMAYMYLVPFVLACLNSNGVNSDCSVGKTTCITEDLLNMVVRMNRNQPNEETTKKIAFFAFLKTSLTYKSGEIIKFNNVVTNRGNHYNPTTGVFTAPKDGLYVLSCMIMANGPEPTHLNWFKNGSRFSDLYVAKSVHHANSQSQNIIFDLKSGDRIHMQSSGTYKVHGSHYTYFSGYCL